MERLVTKREIRTHSGRYVDIWNLKEGDIIIEDIAHALSHLCRWGGHIEQFFSVAEHSVRTALYVQHRKPEQALAALLHDATEAYLVDIPRPIKYELTQYREIEDMLMQGIAKEYNLTYPFDPIVKEADDQMLQDEWNFYILPKDTTPKWSPAVAKQMFMELFEDLSAIRQNETQQKAYTII